MNRKPGEAPKQKEVAEYLRNPEEPHGTVSILSKPLIHPMCIFLRAWSYFDLQMEKLANSKDVHEWSVGIRFKFPHKESLWPYMLSVAKGASFSKACSSELWPWWTCQPAFHHYDNTPEIASCGGTHLQSSHLGDGGRRIQSRAGHQSGTQEEKTGTGGQLSTLCWYLKG